jgi:hypothetical protein
VHLSPYLTTKIDLRRYQFFHGKLISLANLQEGKIEFIKIVNLGQIMTIDNQLLSEY